MEGFDYYFIAESFETSVRWGCVSEMCVGVKNAIRESCQRRGITKTFISCRVTQLYATGACIYFYFGFNFKDLDGDAATVTREVDGGLQTIKVNLPAIITADLRLNEPRYASLPNIMKAKKKPLDEKTAADYGVDTTPRLEVVKTGEPAERAAGIMVGSVDELVAKLKEAGAV